MKTRLRRNTPEEEAAINAGIAADPDTVEWTDEEFASARPAREMMPPEVYDALVANSKRHRGKQVAPTRELVAIRLDRDVVTQLRATGRGWQGRLNATIRKAVLGEG